MRWSVGTSEKRCAVPTPRRSSSLQLLYDSIVLFHTLINPAFVTSHTNDLPRVRTLKRTRVVVKNFPHNRMLQRDLYGGIAHAVYHRQVYCPATLLRLNPIYLASTQTWPMSHASCKHHVHASKVRGPQAIRTRPRKRETRGPRPKPMLPFVPTHLP